MVGPRELEQDIGRQSAAVPRIKFHGAGISGAPGSGPGGEYLRQQLGEVFMLQTAVTMAVYPSSCPDIVRSGSSAGRENTEGRCGPAGRRAHQYCFGFICQRQRPMKRGHRPRFLKGRMSRQFRIFWKWQRFLVDIFRRPPALRCRKWWRQGTRYMS